MGRHKAGPKAKTADVEGNRGYPVSERTCVLITALTVHQESPVESLKDVKQKIDMTMYVI